MPPSSCLFMLGGDHSSLGHRTVQYDMAAAPPGFRQPNFLFLVNPLGLTVKLVGELNLVSNHDVELTPMYK